MIRAADPAARRADAGSEAAERSRRAILRAFLAAWAVLFALSAAWAISNPLTAAVDEPSHMIKAAGTVRGELRGTPVEGDPSVRMFHVPAYVAETQSIGLCERGRPSMHAGCLPAVVPGNTATVEVFTTAGDANPVYSALVGWPTLLLDGARALFGMRLASALLASGLLALGFAGVAALRRRSWTLAASAIAVTPIVLHFAGSVNPMAMEAPAGFALAAWLLALVDARRRVPRPWAAVWAAASAILLLCASAASPIWALAIGAVVLLGGGLPRARHGRGRLEWLALSAVAVAAVAAVGWTLRTGAPLFPRIGGDIGGVSFWAGAESMLSHTLDHASGYVSMFGWDDTAPPWTLALVWGGLMVAVALAALFIGRGPARGRAAWAVVAVVLLPALVQGALWPVIGYVWQDRYLLALVLAMLVVAGAALDSGLPPIGEVVRGRTALWMLLAGLWIMSLFALLWNLRRHVTGIDEKLRDWSTMLADPSWQPPGHWLLWAGLLAVAAAVGAVLLARAAVAERGEPALPPDAELDAEPAPGRTPARGAEAGDPLHGSCATSSLEILREDA